MGNGPVVVNLPQQFFGIGKLGQTLGIGEIGHFQSSEPGQNQLLHDPQFGTGGNQTLFALEPSRTVVSRMVACCGKASLFLSNRLLVGMT